MKVAVVNSFDVKDIKNWSGIPFHLSVFLERFFGTDNIDFVAIPLKRGLFSYLKGLYYNRLKKLNYLSDFDGAVLAANNKAFKDVRTKGYDLINGDTIIVNRGGELIPTKPLESKDRLFKVFSNLRDVRGL